MKRLGLFVVRLLCCREVQRFFSVLPPLAEAHIFAGQFIYQCLTLFWSLDGSVHSATSGRNLMLRTTSSFSGNFRWSAFYLAGRPKRKRGWHGSSELLVFQDLKSWRKWQIGTPTSSNLLYLAVYRLLSFERWTSLSFAWVPTVVKLKTRFLERILALLAKDLRLIAFDLCFKTKTSIWWVKEPGWGLVRRVGGNSTWLMSIFCACEPDTQF